MWLMPMFDPPLEITDEQRAAAMPWVRRQTRLMWGVLVSYGLLSGYLVFTAIYSQPNWYLVALWYVVSSTIFTGLGCYGSYRMSRIAGDDGRLFRVRDWWWMFPRPFVVVLMFYLIWAVPDWLAK